MTFTRQRSDGSHESNSSTPSSDISPTLDAIVEQQSLTSRLTSRSIQSIATFAIAAFAITVPTLLPAQARYYSRYRHYGRYHYTHSYQKSSRTTAKKPTRRATDEVTTGVWGWTKGSQTFLRVRPTAKTPFVAKVPRHTKLFVWGKFDGWYRVETPDHVFGWVYNQYVNAPEDYKLTELSHAKAKIACDRSAKQLMYGPPELLRTYYAAYRAPGAMRGLEKMGIRVASAKPRTKTVVARTNHKPFVRTVAKPAPAKANPVRVVAKPAPKYIAPRHTAPRVVSVPPQSIPATAEAQVNANEVNVQPVAPGQIPVENSASTTPKVAQPTVKKQPWRSASTGHSKKSRSSKHKGRRPVVAAVPPMQVSSMSAITADDIMRAREAHMGARHKTSPTAPAPKLPEKIEEAPSANNGQASIDNGQAAVQPSSTELFTAPSLPSTLLAKSPALAGQEILPAPLQGIDGAYPMVTIVSLKKAPPKASTSAKKPVLNRGGSPRDYALYAQQHAQQQQNGFGDGMASQALSYRGMPYISGASSPNRGFDCSGLVYYLLRQRGYNPPRTAASLASYGTPVAKDKLAPGDILLFANTYHRGVSHVGVYLGNDKFVHAANHRAGVRVDPLFSGYYARKYYGARRVQVRK